MPTYVKIVATIGPASGMLSTIVNMVKGGVSGFRVNFAHGSPSEWTSYVEHVREAERLTGRPLALIGDLQGPSVRIGKVAKPIKLARGDVAKIVNAQESEGGDTKIMPLPNAKFFEVVDVGDVIVMDDGRVRLRVADKASNYVEVVALTESVISSRKVVVVQGKELEAPLLAHEDLYNLKFAVEKGFDYIGLSYVRSAEDIGFLRELLKKLGGEDIGIIAKVETPSAIRNLKEIVEASDVALVARGDLGMSFGLEEVYFLQRRVVEESLRRGKPVIVATQLLESMIERPVPTRAEVVDISAAIESGVDALMLTGETSVGKYPLEAVNWLAKVASLGEREISRETFNRVLALCRSGLATLHMRFAKGVTELAEDLGAKLVVFSVHGGMARALAALKPLIPIYVGSPHLRVLRKLALLWGLHPLSVDVATYEEGLQMTLSKARELGFVKYGDLVVMAYGLRGPSQRIEVLRVM